MTDSFSDRVEPLHERLKDFHEWVKTVRDPARLAAEGIRRIITSNRKATAEYEIAQLPDSRHAARWHLSYNSGNMSGHGAPWSAYANRDECVDAFLTAAQRHFGTEKNEPDICESQREAREQMIALLRGGLFGFIEPEPEPQDQ